jgi:cytochrome c oxidase subunit I+III
VFVWNVLRSLRHGQPAGDNPWHAWTLEWATSSPPPSYNFAALPPIRSARPLWDLQHARPAPQAATAGAGLGQAMEHSPLTGFAALPTPLLGVLTFISSEAIFFGSLIAAFIEYRTRSTAGPGPSDLVETLPRTLLFSLCLFASSGTIWLAERRLARDDQRGFQRWLLATIGLGAVFLIGQLTEYIGLYREGITAGTNLFTSAFFTLTGFHGLHVFVGLIALGVTAAMALAGDFRAGRRHAAVQAVSAYWHFVDGVWVVILSVVYLWALVG